MTEKPHLSSLQRRVVLLLLKRGPLPRSGVAEELGVSRPRLSPEIAHLIGEKLVREAEAERSTGGRRGSWLHLGGPGFGAFCGVDIDADRATIALIHFDGTIAARARMELIPNAEPNDTLNDISDLLEAELRSRHMQARAIGVSIAADVDKWGNLSDSPPTMPQWAGVAVGDHFASRLDVPTFVENDVNALALAEGMHGTAGSEHDSYAVVKVSSGVGCGLIVNGALVRGSAGHAGDIGHICLDPANTSLCACGNLGCLEAVVSTPALIREASHLAESGRSPVLATMLSGGPLTLDSISFAAQRDDPATVALLREAGRHVGYIIAGMVAVLNPGAIFVATGISGAEDLILSAIRERVYERARPAATRGLEILPSRFWRDDGAFGAAILACRGLVGAR